MPHGGADAIGAGVAAADDDDVLAGGGNGGMFVVAVEQGLGVGLEKFHGEMDAVQGRALRRADRAAWSRRCRG